MPPETRKLITFANYSNPSSSFVNIKVSVYSEIIPCFMPPKNNTELKQTFAQYGVNTPRFESFENNVHQRVYCLDATYIQDVFLKIMLTTADFWTKNDRHFHRMGNPVNIKA